MRISDTRLAILQAIAGSGGSLTLRQIRNACGLAGSPASHIYWLRDHRLVTRVSRPRFSNAPARWKLSPALAGSTPATLPDIIAVAPPEGPARPRKVQSGQIGERTALRILRALAQQHPQPLTDTQIRLDSMKFWSAFPIHLERLEAAGLVERCGSTQWGDPLWRATSDGIRTGGGPRRFLTRAQSEEETAFLRLLAERGMMLLEPYQGSLHGHETRCRRGHLARICLGMMRTAASACSRCADSGG